MTNLEQQLRLRTLKKSDMTTNNNNEPTQNINESQDREIILWKQNTSHRGEMYEAITANNILKMKRGTFDEQLAIKGILNLVHATIRDYNLHFRGAEERLGRVNMQ